MELISIIIPNYNRDEQLPETLRSISEQTYENWECLIIDDGSTDESKSVAMEYVSSDDRFRWISRPSSVPKGANGCRNYGFKLSKGVFIQWFDSDDIMESDLLDAKHVAMSGSTDVVIHRNRYANYHLTRFRESKFEYEEGKPLLYFFGLDKFEMQTSCGLWRKSFLENRKLWDERFTRYQDNEFHIRMLAESPRMKIIDKVLATIRGGSGHPTQISSQENLNTKKLLDIYEYRRRSLIAGRSLPMEYKKTYNPVVFNKMKWALYRCISFETNLMGRVRIHVKEVFRLMNFITDKAISVFVIFKTIAYVKYLTLFPSAFNREGESLN